MRKQFVGVCAFGLFAVSLSAVGCAAETQEDDPAATQEALSQQECNNRKPGWEASYDKTCGANLTSANNIARTLETANLNPVKAKITAFVNAVTSNGVITTVGTCLTNVNKPTCDDSSEYCKLKAEQEQPCACGTVNVMAAISQCLLPAAVQGDLTKIAADPEIKTAYDSMIASAKANAGPIASKLAQISLKRVAYAACSPTNVRQTVLDAQMTACRADCTEADTGAGGQLGGEACAPNGYPADVKCGAMSRSGITCECKNGDWVAYKPCATYDRMVGEITRQPDCVTTDGFEGVYKLEMNGRDAKKVCIRTGGR